MRTTTIGSEKTGGAQADWFSGQAADVQLYPRALSAAEVGTLYGTSNDITTNQLVTTWTRDQRGLPTSMTNPDGQVTSYSYDEAGNLALTTAPVVTTETYGNAAVTAHPVITAGYDTFGDTAESEDPDGNVTTYTYDADGRKVATKLPPYTPPGGSAITAVDTTAYDGDGQVTSTTDGLGNLTKYTYDQLGDQVTVTAPDSSVTTTAYDADGEPLSVTGPTGAQTQATWDYLGRQLTSTQVERYSGSGTVAYTTGYTYGDAGGPGGGGGWLSQQTSPDGVSTKYVYDAAGETTAVTDGVGNQTSYSYDSLGRQTKLTYPDGTATATGYDGAGNPVSVKQLDASGNTLTTSSAAFDGEGDQLSVTDPAGNNSTFTYDPTGMVTQEVQPVSATSAITTSFGYDAAGNSTRYTDGNGNQWWDTYNNWGLQASRVEPYTTQYTTAANSTFTTAYDADQDPVTETEPGGGTVTDAYNNVGELTGQSGTGATSVADAAGTTSYTYDDDGRLATLADPATGTTGTYSYNSDSLVTGISYGPGKDSQSFGYDSERRLTSQALKSSSGSTVASVGYGYNADSEITSQTTTGLAGATSNTYAYDEAGRLTSWSNGTTTTAYGYDGNGNLTQSGAKTYTYDARDELTGNGTSSFTYTARGTPSAEPGAAGGTLATTFDAYGDQATAGARGYAYDGLGRLTSDTASGAGYTFSYVGSTGAIASDGTSAYTWDPSGGTLVATGAPGGGTGGALALTDAHGNQVGQFTAAGTAVSGSKGYDPWGTVTATTGTVAGLLGFQSAWTDPAAGKALMGARWYDPGAGDFTSADTVQVNPDPDPAAGNPFAYAADDPLDLTDPTGHCFCLSALKAAVSTVAHAATSTYDKAKSVVKSVVVSAAAISVKETEALRAVTAHAVRDVKAVVKDTVTVVRKTAQVVVATARTVVKQVVKTAKTVAKKVVAAAKTVASAAKTVARHVASAAVTAGRAVASASVAAGSYAWSHRQGLLQAGMIAAAVGLTVINVLQLGLDPATDAVEAADVGALVADAGAEEGASIAAETGAETSEAATSEAGTSEAGTSEAGADDPGTEEDPSSCPTAGGQSFAAGTLVLLATGKAVPISSLKPGDKVLATDTRTGKNQPETVTAVLVHHDTDLYNLTIKTSHGTQVIHTTTDHLFWDPSLDYGWIPAKDLKPGERLKAADGTLAIVVGGSTPKVHDGWMWDLTVPGNNDHDFYVEPATVLPSTRVGPAVAVLVHNSSCRFSVNSAGTVTDNQGPAGIVLNKASGDGFRDTVASFLRSQGRTVTTDADSRSVNTFQALGKPRILDMMVQDDSGSTLGYVETKYGSAAAKYEGSFQQEQDEWLRQNMGLTIDVVSGG